MRTHLKKAPQTTPGLAEWGNTFVGETEPGELRSFGTVIIGVELKFDALESLREKLPFQDGLSLRVEFRPYYRVPRFYPGNAPKAVEGGKRSPL